MLVRVVWFGVLLTIGWACMPFQAILFITMGLLASAAEPGRPWLPRGTSSRLLFSSSLPNQVFVLEGMDPVI